jgi:oligopeptide transport system substrate-binding protein
MLGVIPVLFALVLASCGGVPEIAPTAPVPTTIVPPTAQPSAGSNAPADTLRWSVEGLSELTSLDPAKPGDAPNNAVINLIFSGLVRLNGKLEVQPDGASDWKVSNDGKTYTFTIREGLKFGDGTPVIADDFVFSFNRAMSPEVGAFAASAHFGHIVGAEDVMSGKALEATGIKALDDRTLEITLDSPIAYFLALLTYSDASVVPRTLLASPGDWQEQAYGSGPYKVKEWRHGQSILLVANEHYWQGKPGIPNILMPFNSDSETAYQLYQTGELDIMGSQQNPVPTAHIAEVQNLPDFKSAASLATRYIGFNQQKAPFDNVDVRRAFALAIDKATLANQILGGAVVPAERILPTGLQGTQLPITPLAFDPAAAKAALAQAGYPDAKGFPEVTLTYGKEGDNDLVAQALQSMWQQNLGINVKLQVFELATFSKNLDTTYNSPEQGLQFYYSIWGADYPDPQNFLSLLLRTDQPNNNGHFSDQQFDKLTAEADQLGDRTQIERRLQLYNQAEQIAIDKVAWLPVFYPKFSVLVRPRVQGIAATPQGLIIDDWSKLALE